MKIMQCAIALINETRLAPKEQRASSCKQEERGTHADLPEETDKSA